MESILGLTIRGVLELDCHTVQMRCFSSQHSDEDSQSISGADVTVRNSDSYDYNFDRSVTRLNCALLPEY